MINLSKPFIERPIATSLLMITIFLTGLIAFQFLPISSLPEVDYPTIQVSTFYPGASPFVMASAITAPLERQFGQMPGLNQMTSSSSGSSSIINLQFNLDLNLDVAEQEVQAAINASFGLLPRGIPNPPTYNKINPADVPIMTLALTSNTLTLPNLEDIAETTLSQKISQLSGVGQVSLSGGERPAVRIAVNSTALANQGLTLEDVRTAISNSNVNAAKGNLDGPLQSYTIDTNDQLLESAAYKPLIIAYKNNAPIRLQDIANISDDVENNKLAAWMNLQPAIIMNIARQPGANVINVVDRIKQLLPQLEKNLPSALSLHILSDRTLTIRASIHNIEIDLMISIALVILVIFIFLRHLPATFIPSISVPLSLVGTFGVMYLLGFSINNLTLMALTIATGFVVDDAIVMIENISRYVEQGFTPFEAAIKGASQIGFTILSLTISLIAVLIPLLFMTDVIGRLFREFALTVSITILISALVSLTLTPMLSAKLLKHRDPESLSPFEKKTLLFQQKIINRYAETLKIVLNHQPVVLLITVLTLILTFFLIFIIPKGFFPIQDTGLIQGISVAPESTSFQNMSLLQQKLGAILSNDSDILNQASFIGIDGTNLTLNSGRIYITLKPFTERSETAAQIIRNLQTKLQDIPDISLYMQPIQDLTLDDRVSRTQFQFSLSSPDANQVATWSNKLVAELKNYKALTDITTDEENNGLETAITIDRDNASRLGINPLQIDNILYDAFGQRQVSTMFTERNQYHVILENAHNLNLDSLQDIYLMNSQLMPIPLSALTEISENIAPLIINRENQFPATTISFNLNQGASLGDATAAFQKAIQNINLPDSIQATFEGSARLFQNSLNNEGWLVLAAILVVYIILGVLYESYIHPITILSTLPSASLGALLTLIITRHELTVIAIIGIILLIGIVMKNAIMMIDFALELERKENKSAQDAIFDAAILRFRPILMTTLASLFGAIPLAVESGMGSELRQPLGIAIIGGLIVSQLLTLYTTPVIYITFDHLARNKNAPSKP